MTVAVGLVCSDGVVLASDSMVSTGQIATNGQKVFSLSQIPVIWAGAGDLYTIGQFEAAMTELDGQDRPSHAIFTTPNTRKIRNHLRDLSHATLLDTYSKALPKGLEQLNEWGGHQLWAQFLVLGYAAETPYFFELGGGGEIWWTTPDRFKAIGSGGSIAQVAHALMSHYLEDAALTMDNGLRFAFRAVQTTCDVSAGFVGPPVQMAIVDDSGAHLLDSDRVREIEESVARWKTVERESLVFPSDLEDLPAEGLPSLEGTPTTTPDVDPIAESATES
jgi:20S proteasome alpha/beta subunit